MCNTSAVCLHLYNMRIFSSGFSYILKLELIICIFWNTMSSTDCKGLYKCKGVVISSDFVDIPGEIMENGENERFRLLKTSQEINCPVEESFNYTVDLTVDMDNIDDDAPHNFNSAGILRLTVGTNRIFRNTRDYCVQRISSSPDSLTLSVCNVTCGPESERPCIHKCCGPNAILGYDDKNEIKCQDPKSKQLLVDWKPPFYKTSYLKLSENEQNSIQPNYYQEHVHCHLTSVFVEKNKHFTGKYHHDINTNGFRLLRNGKINFCSDTGKWVELWDDFCVDSIQNFGENDNVSFSGDYTTFSFVRFPCSNFSNASTNATYWIEASRSDGIVYTVLYYILMPIASVNLFIVIIVYTLLWDKHKAQGYTIFSYVCSLFLLYLSLSISYAIPVGTPACKIVAVFVHFLFISTFCYLTAINFDIWWTFRKMKNVSPSKQIKKYMAYSIICCTAPTIMVSVGLTMDSFNLTSTTCAENEVHYLSPRYGENVCGVRSAAQGWYIYFPVGVLLFCNGVFFIMTAISMYRYKKDTNCILRGQSTREEKPAWLFIKLFIVMGIVWVLEFLGWALRPERSVGANKSITWFILIIDTIDLLQAVAIFYIFVCKRHIFLQLWQKHVWLRSLLLLLVKAGCCKSPPETFRKSMPTQAAVDCHTNNGNRSRNTSIQSMASDTTTISGSIAITTQSSNICPESQNNSIPNGNLSRTTSIQSANSEISTISGSIAVLDSKNSPEV